MKTLNLAILAGDGVGSEIMSVSLDVLHFLKNAGLIDLNLQSGLVGGVSIRDCGAPITQQTIEMVKKADAVLFGAVGDYSFDHLPQASRPEVAILSLRKELNLFANLRPIFIFNELIENSTIKSEVIKEVDLMIVRELTGDIYFGQPRGFKTEQGVRYGYNTMIYSEPEIERIAKVAFELALKRGRKVTSIDKANVLEAMQFWRDTVTNISKSYDSVQLNHLYVDNAAMQLVCNPRQFDVMLTGNIFGDILSDQASMITGSIGLLPSASLSDNKFGLYEPIHGSAPDIAGKNLANPIAMLMSLSMMFKYSFNLDDLGHLIEKAIRKTLNKKIGTIDICKKGWKVCGTKEIGVEIIKDLESLC